MESKFYPVTLTKGDTCLTYVLKRIGQHNQSKQYILLNFLDYFNTIEIDNKHQLKVGDIILWNKKMYFEKFNNAIDKNGIIFSTEIPRNIHVAIVEKIVNEKIFYTECMIDKENHGIPCIKMKELTKRTPDFILKLK